MADDSKKTLKVLQAPINYANQAALLSRGLRAQGVNSVQLRYRFPYEGFQFYVDDERTVRLSEDDWYGDMLRTVQQVAAEGFDVIHFWNRTLLHWRPGDVINGMDLPFLKLSGARLAFHFTGYDLRRKSLELKLNRFSPYNYGFNSPYDENEQQRWLDSIAPYIDEFIVQDVEMRSYLPGAQIIPRALELENFALQDGPPNARPLLLHAPSHRQLKGSDFILKAVEELREEGFDFDFQLVENMAHAEALALYRRADIIIDQLLVGWYGVLAMEAMAMGKAAVAYIRDDLVGCFPDGLPLLNANPETVGAVLRDAIKDSELRAEIGRKGRRFVEQVHDCRVVARTAVELYDHMLLPPPARIVPDFNGQLKHSAAFTAYLKGGPRSGNSWTRMEQLEKELAANVARIAQLDERLDRELAQTAEIDRLRDETRQFDAREHKHIALIKELKQLEATQRARADALETDVATLKSALAEAVYDKARTDALAAEAAAVRDQAKRWRNVEATLPALRKDAERYRELEPELRQLRNQTARTLELQNEVISLRYKARRYDEAKDRLAIWQRKAEHYDAIMKKAGIRHILRLLGIGRIDTARAAAAKDTALKPAE